MKYFLRSAVLQCFLIVSLLAGQTIAWAQTPYKNGVKQGQIKVKFTSEMSSTLTQTTVHARTSGFTTGIQTLDATAKSTKAKNMYRMFPYDAKFEGKLRKH